MQKCWVWGCFKMEIRNGRGPNWNQALAHQSGQRHTLLAFWLLLRNDGLVESFMCIMNNQSNVCCFGIDKRWEIKNITTTPCVHASLWEGRRYHRWRACGAKWAAQTRQLKFRCDWWDGLLESRRGSRAAGAIRKRICFKSGSPIDLTSCQASAGPRCCVITPGINGALGLWRCSCRNGQCAIHLFLCSSIIPPLNLCSLYIFHFSLFLSFCWAVLSYSPLSLRGGGYNPQKVLRVDRILHEL